MPPMGEVHDSDGTAPLGGPAFSRRDLLRGAAAVGAAAGLASLLPGVAEAAKAKFPIGASAKAKTPVSITMWHSMTENNLTTLQNLTNAFNASQPHVKVNLVGQNSYTDTETAYTTALSGGLSKLPDLVQWETELIEILVDSQSVVPVGSAVAADHYSLSDFVPSMLNFFRINGTQWALPFNVSNQVLYYDQNAFAKAGLDPTKPPASLAALRSAAEKIVSSGTAKYGMSLKQDASTFELLMSMGNDTVVNHSNGRKGRATAVTFDDKLGQSIFSWWAGMLNDNLAQATPDSGSGTYDNLLAIGSHIAPMTFDTSAALGTILLVLSQGQYASVKLGVGPVPSPGTKPTKGGGVFIGGAGLYIVKKSPAAQDAAWQFIKYLSGPAQQATWAVGTGYVPVRKSSLHQPTLTQAWGKIPFYRVPYNQLLSSPVNPACAGYVSGAASQIDTALSDAITSLSSGTNAKTALAQAAATANSAITSYNERV
jgi:sn-glycerol 3-phosphate transport system substrate-binding protein